MSEWWMPVVLAVWFILGVSTILAAIWYVMKGEDDD